MPALKDGFVLDQLLNAFSAAVIAAVASDSDAAEHLYKVLWSTGEVTSNVLDSVFSFPSSQRGMVEDELKFEGEESPFTPFVAMARTVLRLGMSFRARALGKANGVALCLLRSDEE